MPSRTSLVDLDFGGIARVKGLPDPVASGDAVPKGYLDAMFEGLSWKDGVRAASTATLTLSAPGAAIDGVTMAAGDRFLAKDQTPATENGIYVWNGAAVAATRAADANVFAELEAAVVAVEEGTVGAGTSWRQTQVNGVLGTDNVSFVAYGTGGGGWTQIAQISGPTGTNVDFTNIPQNYSDLMVVIVGASHNGGANYLNIRSSPNGTTFSASLIAISTTISASGSVGGAYMIPNYTKDWGLMQGGLQSMGSTPDQSNGGAVSVWRCDGGIKALRFSWSAGSHDAGVYTLYGRP